MAPAVGEGEGCKEDANCKSGLCLNEFCCASEENKDGCASCLENNGKCEACRDTTWFLSSGICKKTSAVGESCSSDGGCSNGSCKGRVCCNNDGKDKLCENCDGSKGGSCNKCDSSKSFLKAGACVVSYADGEACDGSGECANGSCKGGHCCGTSGRHPSCNTCGNDGGCADTTTPYNGTPTTSSTTTTTATTTTSVTATTRTTSTGTTTTTVGPPGQTIVSCQIYEFTGVQASLKSGQSVGFNSQFQPFPTVLGVKDNDGLQRVMVKMDRFFKRYGIPLTTRVACKHRSMGRPDLFGTDKENCVKQVSEEDGAFTPVFFVKADISKIGKEDKDLYFQQCFMTGSDGQTQDGCALGMLKRFVGGKYNIKLAPDYIGMDRATPDVHIDYNLMSMDQHRGLYLVNKPLVTVGAVTGADKNSKAFACNVVPMFIEWVVNCGGFEYDRFYNFPEEQCQARSKCNAAGFYRGKDVSPDNPGDQDKIQAWWSSDAHCLVCSAETFKDTDRAGDCYDWKMCNAGEYVDSTHPASEVRDRACLPCQKGQYMEVSDHTFQSCKKWTECDFQGAGEEAVVEPSAVQDRVCSAVIRNPDLKCVVGEYRHRGDDDDLYTCLQCPEKMSSPAVSTSPDECACISGYFEVEEDVCKACTMCGKDLYRDTESTCVGGYDYTCLACPDGSITSGIGSVGVDACFCPANNFNGAERGKSPSCSTCPENSESVKGSVDQRHCECNTGFYDSDESVVVACTACTACNPALNLVRDPTSSCGDRVEGTDGQRDYSCIRCENGTHTADGLICVADDVVHYCADGKISDDFGQCGCEPPSGCSCTVNDPTFGSDISVTCTNAWNHASPGPQFPVFTTKLDLRGIDGAIDAVPMGLAHLSTLLLNPAVMPQLQQQEEDTLAPPLASSSLLSGRNNVSGATTSYLRQLPACPDSSLNVNAEADGVDEAGAPQLAISICSNSTGACGICSPGSFSKADGSGCEMCAAGGFFLSYAGAAGSSTHCACEQCNNGTFAPEGGTDLRDCKVCPIGTDTSVQAGYRACPCLDGFSRTNRFGACSDCTELEGIVCAADSRIVQPGFWWYFSSKESETNYVTFVNDLQDPIGDILEYDGEFPTTYRCTRAEACLGGHGGAYLESNVMTSGSCQAGFGGPKCSLCEASYYGWYGTCKECPDASRATASAVVIVLIMAAALMLALRKNASSVSEAFTEDSDIDGGSDCCGSKMPDCSLKECCPAAAGCLDQTGGGLRFMTALKIIFGHFQVTGAIKTMFSAVSWPGNYQSFVAIFEVASTNPLVWILPSCINSKLDTNVYFDFTVTALIPIFALAGIIVYVFVRTTQNKNAAETSAISLKNFCLVFFFVYPIIGSTAFRILTAPTELCTGGGSECKHYLPTDYSVDTDLELHSKMKRLSLAAIFIYSFGAPLVLLSYMGYLRGSIQNVIDGTATFANSGQALLLGLGFAYDDYKPKFWYWEVVEMLRKLFLCAVIMVIPDPNVQMFYGAGLAILSLCLHIYCLPYRNPRENLLAALSLSAIVLTIIIGWLLWSIELESRANVVGAINSSSSTVAGVFLIIILVAVILSIVYLLVPKCSMPTDGKDAALPTQAEKKSKEVVAFVNPVYQEDPGAGSALISGSTGAGAEDAPVYALPVEESFAGFGGGESSTEQGVTLAGASGDGVNL